MYDSELSKEGFIDAIGAPAVAANSFLEVTSFVLWAANAYSGYWVSNYKLARLFTPPSPSSPPPSHPLPSW